MNDEAAKKQIEQMRSFILQEAEEKSNEIRAKAKEEADIEKQKLVMADKKKIQSEYDRKQKQVIMQQRISLSQESNQSRLHLLKAQEESLNIVENIARKELLKVQEDKEKYRKLMKLLIIQGCEVLRETAVVVICRECDIALVKELLPECKTRVKEITSNDVELSVDPKKRLPEKCSGGVVLHANKGKVMCSNTLENRLALALEVKLPVVRDMLFPTCLKKSVKRVD